MKRMKLKICEEVWNRRRKAEEEGTSARRTTVSRTMALAKEVS